jgi:thiaminase/transcriptional activator TenA
MAALDTILESGLIRAAGGLWGHATRAAFLDALAAGKLPEEAFQGWLAQDYLFARELLAFQAILLSKSPRSCHTVLAGGLVALDSELSWFESQAERLSLDLKVEPHPVCRRYGDFMIRSAYTEPAAVLLAVLFGIEVSYLAAWSALKPEGEYKEFIERWSNPDFIEYVAALQGLTEKHLHQTQQAAFDQVLELERDFWRMTWEG